MCFFWLWLVHLGKRMKICIFLLHRAKLEYMYSLPSHYHLCVAGHIFLIVKKVSAHLGWRFYELLYGMLQLYGILQFIYTHIMLPTGLMVACTLSYFLICISHI